METKGQLSNLLLNDLKLLMDLVDTTDYYLAGHNEMLISHNIKGKRDKAFESVKLGS